jgi:serine/threonine protein phosphatase PrpC
LSVVIIIFTVIMGSSSSKSDTFKKTERGATATGLVYAMSTMVGRRKEQEDVYLIQEQLDDSTLKNHSLFGVFDGHGGVYAAKYAAGCLQRILMSQDDFQEYKASAEQEEGIKGESITTEARRAQLIKLEEALKDAFVELDRQLLVLVQGEREKELTKSKDFKHHHDMDAGATACVVLVTPHYIVCANAGDSRAIFVQSDDNTIVPLSQDHKPYSEEEEKRIRNAGGFVYKGRVDDDLAVSRGFGDYRLKDEELTIHGTSQHLSHASEQKVSPLPEVISIPRKDGYIVLACDGVFDVRKNEHLRDDINLMFKEGESDYGLVCEEILDLCYESKSRDNMTLIMICFGENARIGQGSGVVGRRAVRASARRKALFASCLPQ